MTSTVISYLKFTSSFPDMNINETNTEKNHTKLFADDMIIAGKKSEKPNRILFIVSEVQWSNQIYQYNTFIRAKTIRIPMKGDFLTLAMKSIYNSWEYHQEICENYLGGGGEWTLIRRNKGKPSMLLNTRSILKDAKSSQITTQSSSKISNIL